MRYRAKRDPSTAEPLVAAAPCPICAETRRAYLFVIRGLPVVRCPQCGLVSLDLPPGRADSDNCDRGPARDVDPRRRWADNEIERRAARHCLALLRERGLEQGRVLVVAPPGHPFAVEAHAQGFKIGMNLPVAAIEDGQRLDEGYDAAVLLYQLEQARAPENLLQAVHCAVKPKGLLLLTTPSSDSWPAHLFRDQWTEWRPENRFYFDSSTLQSMLLRWGFARIHIESDRRDYTLEHIHDRAAAFPRTWLTRAILRWYRWIPARLQTARVQLATSGLIAAAVRVERRERPLCSIVVPVYNERPTFPVLMDRLLAKTLPGMDREIIIVESNSNDGSREIALGYAAHPDVRLVLQDQARGKGNALRAGFEHAKGDLLLIQDADLEYDVNDYDELLEPLVNYRAAFVLGARHGGRWKMRQFTDQRALAMLLNAGHLFFTALLNLLYGQHLADPFTMFKVFRRDCLFGLEFECNRFDFDHELVIKLVRKGYTPIEIPVNYRSRSFREGKKVSLLRDPWTWLWACIRFRFAPLGNKHVCEEEGDAWPLLIPPVT